MPPDLRPLFSRAAEHAARFRETLPAGPARPTLDYHQMRERFSAPTPETGTGAETILDELAELSGPGLMPTVGPRFFAWVMGASHPAGVAADMLVSAWGQNAGYQSTSPAAAALEETAERWLLDILDLPEQSGIGFTTGATVANFTCLAAARTSILQKVGWNADDDGLFGAPPVHVLVGADAHLSVFAALQQLGFGRKRVISVGTDDQGRILPAALEAAIKPLSGPKVIIAQAGQINTGAFDPFAEIVEIARTHDAWVHVDGAIGLWARAVPALQPLLAGLEGADSWAGDSHKWLQAPYDSGLAIVRDRDALLGAMSQWSSYLPSIAQGDRVPSNYVPELSRRARGIPVWALIRHFGRQGIADMVERHCHFARRFAELLAAEPGVRIVNDVVLNQVIVNFGTGDAPARKAATEAVIAKTLASGTCYVAGAAWRGDWVMRLSVTSGETTEADIELSAAAIIAAWRAVQAA